MATLDPYQNIQKSLNEMQQQLAQSYASQYSPTLESLRKDLKKAEINNDFMLVKRLTDEIRSYNPQRPQGLTTYPRLTYASSVPQGVTVSGSQSLRVGGVSANNLTTPACPFNEGDIVKLKGGTTGFKVKSVPGMRVYDEKRYSGPEIGMVLESKGWELWDKYELVKAKGGKVNKFKKGDIVEMIKDYDSGLQTGFIAEVIKGDNNLNAKEYLLNLHYDMSQPAAVNISSSFWVKQDYFDLQNRRTKIDFDSVIIAPEKRQQILEALEQVNQHDLIFNKWGFGKTVEKGKGVSMLFHGPPGTGKTLMGQAIADHLGYELKVLSVADIESSAPGESERNIRKHFKEAKGKDVILLFDECDSLIYTREHVGAILGAQINELLSQIERFDGITIFTTNRLKTLDEAVNRRLSLKLEFGMPTREERVQIWQRMFPKETPLEEIDWDKLAVVEITGGYIKNAVLRSARMAAIEKVPDKQKKITMNHLVKSLTLEAQAMHEFEEATKKNPGIIPVGYGQSMGSSISRTRGW